MPNNAPRRGNIFERDFKDDKPHGNCSGMVIKARNARAILEDFTGCPLFTQIDGDLVCMSGVCQRTRFSVTANMNTADKPMHKLEATRDGKTTPFALVFNLTFCDLKAKLVQSGLVDHIARARHLDGAFALARRIIRDHTSILSWICSDESPDNAIQLKSVAFNALADERTFIDREEETDEDRLAFFVEALGPHAMTAIIGAACRKMSASDYAYINDYTDGAEEFVNNYLAPGTEETP